MSFDQQIQSWVQTDNQIRILNEKLKELREKRETLRQNLTQQTKQTVIPISDGKLKFVTMNVASPLTFKYIEKSLNDIIPNKEQVKKITDYLKSNREIKTIQEIKRF